MPWVGCTRCDRETGRAGPCAACRPIVELEARLAAAEGERDEARRIARTLWMMSDVDAHASFTGPEWLVRP